MKFSVPARITVEAGDEREAIAMAQNLADAADRLGARGHGLAVLGPPAPVPTEDLVALCDDCGTRRHDGTPCPSDWTVA